jgi:hypothetical protein
MKNKKTPQQIDIDRKDEAVIRLREHGFSIREIMKFMNFKSPKSIQNVFNKKLSR